MAGRGTLPAFRGGLLIVFVCGVFTGCASRGTPPPVLEVRAPLIKDPTTPITKVPKGWPIDHDGREVASGYGFRGASYFHKGMDIKGPFRTPVYATADGVVSFSGQMRGYGNVVKIQHPSGYETVYAHLDACLVTAGERVVRGDTIGTLGQTGNATTPHVHYEVRTAGQPVDPSNYFD